MNPITQSVYTLLNKPLNKLGLEITLERKSRALFHKRIAHLGGLGFSPSVIYDGGAYDGNWTARISETFPGAQVVMVEPNKQMYSSIKNNTHHIKPAPVLELSALGSKVGSGVLNVWSEKDATGSSLLNHVRGEASTQQATPVITLDVLAERTRLTPDFVKLDLQGGELDALMGAKDLLKTVEVWVIEFGVLDAYIGRTTPFTLMQAMYLNDYLLYDITDIMYRPYDGAMLGGDFFFVKADSQLRDHKGYD